MEAFFVKARDELASGPPLADPGPGHKGSGGFRQGPPQSKGPSQGLGPSWMPPGNGRASSWKGPARQNSPKRYREEQDEGDTELDYEEAQEYLMKLPTRFNKLAQRQAKSLAKKPREPKEWAWINGRVI